jgi:hypothetical protein
MTDQKAPEIPMPQKDVWEMLIEEEEAEARRPKGNSLFKLQNPKLKNTLRAVVNPPPEAAPCARKEAVIEPHDTAKEMGLEIPPFLRTGKR